MSLIEPELMDDHETPHDTAPVFPAEDSQLLLEGDLAGADLAGANLVGADLSGRDLTGTDLTGADLTDCRMIGTCLRDAVLIDAKLETAQVLGADLTGADLTNANAFSVVFGQSDLTDAVLFNATLDDATFAHTNLTGADLRTADLKGARLREADLTRTDLSRAKMHGADLTRANVDHAIFRDTDISRARVKAMTGYETTDWIGVDILDTDFAGAYMVRRAIMDQNYLYEFRHKNRLNSIIYQVWRITSDCGRSFVRWTLLTGIIASLFAIAYGFVDIDYGDYETSLSPLYYSIVTMTTLGYGDVTPASTSAQIVVMIQVFIGYIMLGGVLSIFATRMGRRAE